MRYNSTGAWPWLRTVVAIAAAVGILAIAAGANLVSYDESTAHLPHTISASAGDEFAVITDHAHIGDGDLPSLPGLTAAVLPRTAIPLAAVRLLAAVVIVAGSSAHPVRPVVRGAPDAVAARTGREVLFRFCIARR